MYNCAAGATEAAAPDRKTHIPHGAAEAGGDEGPPAKGAAGPARISHAALRSARLQEHSSFLTFWTLHVSSTRPPPLPPPSGQPMSNRMLPGGGNAQPMATRHPGAPNGMCEHSRPTPVPSLARTSLCCSSPHPVSPFVARRPRRGGTSTHPGVQSQLKAPRKADGRRSAHRPRV